MSHDHLRPIDSFAHAMPGRPHSASPPSERPSAADAQTAPPEQRRTATGNVQASPAPYCQTPIHYPAAGIGTPTTALPQRPVRSWPLILLAAPASAAVWSGWAGIGRMTGFGQVHPLPGIWDHLHLDSAITLPIGVEAYAAYALRAWLSTSAPVTPAARRFARWSAITSLALGMAGQIAYHLLTQAGMTRAPWEITTAVSCLPVLVLGMGTALAHLLRAGPLTAIPTGPDQAADPDQAPQANTPCTADRFPTPGQTAPRPDPGPPAPPTAAGQAQLTQARAAGRQLIAARQRISRRALRSYGMKGSNAHLGALALTISAELASTTNAPDT